MSHATRSAVHPLSTLARVSLGCAAEACALVAHKTFDAEEAQRLRRRWFCGLADATEQVMRAAPFLELIGVTLPPMNTPVGQQFRPRRFAVIQGGKSAG